ncbi:cyclic nucleotide-binding domain-containing protein [Zestomonas carbonaria]|uniref:Transcriptional activator protein Anr n=1 Tax=Zestomonas carbonaria TaxID=2762745 RepID=A0A7U7EQ99_9GAMM|nr:cyclic nucleotide-binding domain-containing protein [Pseudomonas carbonaria]CAD5108697.1 Transcriptional activator protein Anr [Pseudomonas carbonaria]
MDQSIKPQPYCRNCRLAPPSISDDQLLELEAVIKPGQLFGKGSYLFRQGDPFDSLYLVRSGSVKTVTSNDQGMESITAFYLPGELFGFSGLDEGRFPVSAVALERTLCSQLPFDQLERLTAEIPGFTHQLMQLMSRKIREDQQVKLLLSRLHADSRIAAFLLNISAHFRDRGYSAVRFRLSMSRIEIADYLGLAVETVSRSFTRMQKQGLLRTEGRETEILDFIELCTLAGGEVEL